MKSTSGIFLVSLLCLGACSQQPAQKTEAQQNPQTPVHQESAENEGSTAALRGSDDDNLSNPQVAAGEEIYETNCAGCHDSGTGGAPRPGNKQDWKGIIDQPIEALTKRSIDGFEGKKGTMPPKGGNDVLTEKEISNAVRYMVFKTK
jgi:cytochrome c5